MTMWVDRLLARERLIAAASLALLCVLAWAYLLSGAGMGAPSSMSGMAMGRPGPGDLDWPASLWVTTIVMWWAMMVAMMVPSAAPTILLFGRVHRQATGGRELAPTGAFAGGYLLAWLGFSVAAAVLHWALQDAGLISAGAMASQSWRLTAAVPIVVGLYQFTPAQALCLRHCRGPAEFLARHWRPGATGAFRLGVLHGAYCVGCCWLLMTLLFIGGVMNLAWIATLTVLVMAQKLVPGGAWIARAAGVGLIVWGVAGLLSRS